MNAELVAHHVLRALAAAQLEGRTVDLAWLASEVPVRRRDLRSAVSALHREGMVDALRMRLSMRGFTVGVALARATLPPLRVAKLAIVAA